MANAEPWAWVPHPEVWILVVGLAALGWWAVNRVGPSANRPGEVVATRRQRGCFVAALAVLLVASDWPVHDIGESYLYSVHMFQHLLLSFVFAPLLLLAIPTWLARLALGSGRLYHALRFLTRPVPATLLFNIVVVFSHWPVVVEASVTNGLLHYGVHVLVVVSALVMWMPVCGPLGELRFSMPVQMVYLFAQSVVPVVPAGWLTFAEGVVYRSYDVPTRVFGLSVVYDQQIAALIMKVVGTTFLWLVILAIFTRFATKTAADDRATGIELDRRAPETLTWDQVERELATAGPAPPEPKRS